MYIEELGMEVKTSSLKFKDIDTKQGIVIGYFAAFGNKDADGDIIVPGAFTKTIKEQGPKSAHPRIKHLLDHNKTKGVAIIQELSEDAVGLRYESKAGRHTLGQDWLLMCEDGIVTEHSIGFETIKNEQQKDANIMSELALWEGSSLQAWGSNWNTPVAGVKAFKQFKYKELSDRFDILEKGFRDGKYSDETFIKLDRELRTIKHLLSILTVDTIQPDSTENTTEPGQDEKDEAVLLAIKQFTLTAFN